MGNSIATGGKPGRVKKTGSYAGKSNVLGYGGRSAQLAAQGVPGGVIGMLARKAGAAPGGPNYHGAKGDSEGPSDLKGKADEAEPKAPRKRFTASKRHPARGG